MAASFAPDPRAHLPRLSVALATWSSTSTAAPARARGRRKDWTHRVTSAALSSSRDSAAIASATLSMTTSCTSWSLTNSRSQECPDSPPGPSGLQVEQPDEVSRFHPQGKKASRRRRGVVLVVDEHDGPPDLNTSRVSTWRFHVFPTPGSASIKLTEPG